MIKYGICRVHRCTYRRAKHVPTDHEFITPSEKTQCQVPEALFDREGISPRHQPVQGKDETFFRFSGPEEAARSVFEEQRDHPLAEAKSEVLKEECKVDSLNVCIREFQRQAHSNCLELDSANCGSRPDFHEELTQ